MPRVVLLLVIKGSLVNLCVLLDIKQSRKCKSLFLDGKHTLKFAIHTKISPQTRHLAVCALLGGLR